MPSFQDALAHIDRLMTGAMKERAIPGLALAITDRERVLSTKAYGVADIGAKTPVSDQSLFEIGSLGKPFTAIVILQLMEAGKLDLHAPVSDYLPWFEVKSAFPPITVHHLLNHTSGLLRGTDIAPHGLYESWALRNRQTITSPGEYFWYSNIGYKTLGFLIERMTGQTLAEAIRSRILEPLGMTSTHAAITADVRRKTAVGHTSIYDDRPEHVSHPVVPAIWADYATGDGAQASNVVDMARYLRMLLNRGAAPNGAVITDKSFGLMIEDGVWTGGDFYGYGLATYDVGGRTYIGHGGGNAGFRSALVVDMVAGLGVIVLLNRMGETDPIVELAQQALTAVRSAHEGQPLPPLPEPKYLTKVADAAAYAGDYVRGEQTLAVRASGAGLVLRTQDEDIALEARGADKFYANHPDFALSLIEFGRQSGAVVDMVHDGDWYVNDRYEGPKLFDYPEHWKAYLGHYRARNPELSNFRVVVRKGRLVLLNPWGNTEQLIPLDAALFRVGEDKLSPERLRFDAVVDGRALYAEYSGCAYYRAFTP